MSCARPPNVDLRDQSGRLIKPPPGPPMTLGNAANAKVRLIVWCKACSHQVEPDPAEMARQYGAPGPASSIGATDLSVPRAVAGKWIWSSSELSGDSSPSDERATYRRGRPARRARPGARSSGVGGLAGGDSGGASGNLFRIVRRTRIL